MKLLRYFIILAILLAAATPVAAQTTAYTTQFITAITYQNVDDETTTSVVLLFYPDTSTTSPIVVPLSNLEPGAGASVHLGQLDDIDPGFRGSAILQADKMLVGTLVQLPQSTTVRNRPLSNGFSGGSSTLLLATVLKNYYNASSIFAIQNVDNEPNDFKIEFYNTSAEKVHTIDEFDVQPGASYYVDAGMVTELGTAFNGSAVITAKRGDASDGKAISTVMELSINGIAARAFESVAAGANKIYMATALCLLSGKQTTNYAVQNASLTPGDTAAVRVTYSNGLYEDQTINPGSKYSFNACTTVAAGFSGAATITSTGAPVVSIGKVGGGGLSTAFLGEAVGANRLALPYIRWSETLFLTGKRQHANIAVQNVGTTEIPTGALSVAYIDKNGVVVTTHTNSSAIPVGSKFNSNPKSTNDVDAYEFGYYPDGTTGGGAIVTCTAPSCQIIAVVRIVTKLSDTVTVGEDYNGIQVPVP
jgi:hypothetical protein